MGFVQEILKKLFPDNQNNSDKGYTPPFYSERLKRSEEFKRNFQVYLESPEWSDLKSEVLKKYHFKKAGLNEVEDLIVMDNPNAAGMALELDSWDNKEPEFLMEYINHKVLGLGYKLQNSNRRVYDKADKVKEIERYYLKPLVSSQDFEPPINQRFGNITVELEIIDNKPKQLRWSASYYHSRDYQKHYPFEELIENVLETK
jgi:hypothetical protein